MITAIVLAGGASERMGRAKALLPLRGSTFLEVILESCRSLPLAEVIVVAGPDIDKMLSDNVLGGARKILNPTPESGPIGSIRLGIGALDPAAEGILVWHVDRPLVRAETVRRLLERLEEGAPIVVPGFQGRRGHPVIFARAVFEELIQVPEGEGARAVVRADPSRVSSVPVEDPAVVEDIDTPEAHRELLEREGS